jgi:ribosomal protein S18 acetylase RimI-like enzyme
MISFRKITLVVTLIFMLGGCGTSKRDKEGIYPYDAALDRDYILQETEKAKFWLIADESIGYNQAETLDTGCHCFVKEPVHFFVYYKDSRPVGFISYYFDSALFGKIQFVFVDEQYRRQGIAEKMIMYALNRMRQEGAISIEICTRLINSGARTLYEKLGFKYLHDNGKYIYLEYSFK